MTTPDGAAPGGVAVAAGARLHLGFFDPNGSLGRGFGSVGLMIDGPQTVVELARADTDRAEAAAGTAAELPRAQAHLERLREASGRREPLALRLAGALAPHAGLGSGTQLALAVAPADKDKSAG